MPPRYLIVAAMLLGWQPACTPALATATRPPAAAPCDPYTGFITEGTVWEYDVSNMMMTGWERAELVGLDSATGEVQVNTEGSHDTLAFIFSFSRSDTYECRTDGLVHTGWTNTWTIDHHAGAFSISGETVNAWDTGFLLLPAAPAVGDTWIGADRLVRTSDTGYTWDEEIEGWQFEITGEVDLDTSLGTLSTLKVQLTDGPAVWYADGYGVVQRSGMKLTDYSP